MHVVIINGSPRIPKYSNTDKIIDSFGKGLTEKGASFEKHAISDRSSWDEIREVYIKNEEILIALPLFVECVPGLLLEFLETLPQKDEHTRLSFILQSGFAEGCQLRCGEEFLQKLPEYLGVRYGGGLVKGDNFGIRLMDGKQRERATKPYQAMGAVFEEGDGFLRKEAKEFTGPEFFPLPVRLLLQMVFKTIGKRRFQKAAASWGCNTPLDMKIW